MILTNYTFHYSNMDPAIAPHVFKVQCNGVSIELETPTRMTLVRGKEYTDFTHYKTVISIIENARQLGCSWQVNAICNEHTPPSIILTMVDQPKTQLVFAGKELYIT